MAPYSSDESCKQNSPSKASIRGELHEAQRTIRRLEEKLQKMEVHPARPSHSSHDEHHAHRPSTRGSSNDHGREEDTRRRRHHHHSHEESYNRDQIYRQVFNIACRQVPSFHGYSDPNVYLDLEAKCEQIFEIHEILDQHKLKLATLEFSDYAIMP